MKHRRVATLGRGAIHKAVDQVFDRLKARVLGPQAVPRRLLEQQRATVTRALTHMERDLAALQETILDVAGDFMPRG